MRILSISVLFVVFLFPAINVISATNLNSSKSNIFMLVYPSDVVNNQQAAEILSELETVKKQQQARVSIDSALKKILEKHSLDQKIKKSIIIPPDENQSLTRIILLSNPGDEAQAIAVTDEGVPGDKPVKKNKSTK